MYSRIITPLYISKYRTDNIFCGFIRDKYSYYIIYNNYTVPTFYLKYAYEHADFETSSTLLCNFIECYNEAVRQIVSEEAWKYTIMYK
jgi:hypothetical protein